MFFHPRILRLKPINEIAEQNPWWPPLQPQCSSAFQVGPRRGVLMRFSLLSYHHHHRRWLKMYPAIWPLGLLCPHHTHPLLTWSDSLACPPACPSSQLQQLKPLSIQAAGCSCESCRGGSRPEVQHSSLAERLFQNWGHP